ncbi:MAG TPA: NfeD family protein [Pyrinomonadaceae bacterium]|nr:NfeD family protein [Pyrinomonadaceae bacterium]
MKLVLLIIILGACALAALFIVIALYRHKNSAMGEVKLIGELGEVANDLNPEGAVVVRGELWRARSSDGTLIAAPARVRIIDARDHLLIVTAD